jgi:anti-sigma factor RsiW
MPCEMFEDLLAGYSELSVSERHEVDVHLDACSGCREYLETLTHLDRGLTALYSGMTPRRVFDPAAVKQPSALPEVLDFCGWAAVVAILAVLSAVVAGRYGITLALPPYAGWYAAGAAAMVAVVSRLTWRRL